MGYNNHKSVCEVHHQEILLLIDQKVTIVQIARTLGIPHSALKGYLGRRHIHSQSPADASHKVDEKRVAEMLALGTTHRIIAEVLGIHRSTVERTAKKLGLQTARSGPRSGVGHPEWKGGRVLEKYGYIGIHAPLHPQAKKTNGRVPEHRLVMEVKLQRFLTREEVVDHKDNCPYHNWPDNLASYACNADHLRAELTGKWASSPRKSIIGAYGCNQKLNHCPNEDETLAQCPLEIRRQLFFYIESFRPTTKHKNLPRRSILRLGAWRNPFLWE
jgi:hypothetical protein